MSKLSPVINRVKICTSLRTVFVWADGYERAALGMYRRTVAEVIYFVRVEN